MSPILFWGFVGLGVMALAAVGGLLYVVFMPRDAEDASAEEDSRAGFDMFDPANPIGLTNPLSINNPTGLTAPLSPNNPNGIMNPASSISIFKH